MPQIYIVRWFEWAMFPIDSHIPTLILSYWHCLQRSWMGAFLGELRVGFGGWQPHPTSSPCALLLPVTEGMLSQQPSLASYCCIVNSPSTVSQNKPFFWKSRWVMVITTRNVDAKTQVSPQWGQETSLFWSKYEWTWPGKTGIVSNSMSQGGQFTVTEQRTLCKRMSTNIK